MLTQWKLYWIYLGSSRTIKNEVLANCINFRLNRCMPGSSFHNWTNIWTRWATQQLCCFLFVEEINPECLPGLEGDGSAPELLTEIKWIFHLALQVLHEWMTHLSMKSCYNVHGGHIWLLFLMPLCTAIRSACSNELHHTHHQCFSRWRKHNPLFISSVTRLPCLSSCLRLVAGLSGIWLNDLEVCSWEFRQQGRAFQMREVTNICLHAPRL